MLNFSYTQQVNFHFFTQQLPKSFTRLLTLVVFLLSCTLAQAVNYESKGTGNWTDANNWSPAGVPTSVDNVTIKAGHIITMPSAGTPFTECNDLTLQSGAILIILTQAHTTYGVSTINGQLLDTQNSGVNTFVGKVTIGAGGLWNTSGVNNINNMIFQGGLEHNGASMVINKAYFNTNSQTISGTSPLSFSGTVQVGSGVTLTNSNSGGITFGPSSNLTGTDGTSSFVNQALIYYSHKDSPMLIGTLDFSPAGNTVVYNRDGFKQGVAGTTYYNLVISPDPALSNFDREPDGDVIVSNDFTIENGAEFPVKSFNITVSGNTVIEGLFNDSELLGTNAFGAVDLSNGGQIIGSNANHGTFTIASLTVSSGTGRIDEGIITVSGSTNILSGATLEIGDYFGTKTFNTLNVASTGAFNMVASNASNNIVFNGAVTNDGTFTGQKGNYTFNDDFTTSASGTFAINDAGIYQFVANLTNNGIFSLTDGDFIFHNSVIGGSSAITFNGSITIAAGSTTTNANTGGIVHNGILDGASAGSTFMNEQSFSYNPSTRDVPMAIGILDASTSGNTFRYSRAGTDQDVKGTTYHHLVFESGTDRTLNDGAVTVNGDLSNSINQVGTDIITMSGNAPQILSGGGAFINLIVNKAAESVTATSNISISNSLTMTSGLLKTNTNIIDMGISGTLSETTTSYVEGKVQAARVVGSGGSSNFGGLGLTINASATAPGTTTVLRTTGKFALVGGIRRFYEITPTTNTSLNASVVFNYLDAEINGLVEANFVLLSNVGGSFNDIGGTLNAGINQMTGASINSFATLTIGDPNSFPVEWLNFSATPNQEGVLLEWSTAFELNNDYFTIERSVDGQIFTAVGEVDGMGTTSSVSNYDFVDKEVFNLSYQNLYYRIRQTDLNGDFAFSNRIQVTLTPGTNIELSAYPNPVVEYLNVQVTTIGDYPTEVKMTDLSGKVIWGKMLDNVSGTNIFRIPSSELASGMYIVSVTDGYQQKFVRVVKP